MVRKTISTMLRRLQRAVRLWPSPVVVRIGRERDSFRVLVSCLLSLRTRDPVTDAASARLFALADNSRALAALPIPVIERAIYPVAFYRTKARNLVAVCRLLLSRHDGGVPDSLAELLALPGVGRKTANLTLIEGFDKPGICVDTHVHRIANRWGYVRTRSADETETALRGKLPKTYWKKFNFLLVAFGQNCCKPVSPLCSECPVARHCPRHGVTRHR